MPRTPLPALTWQADHDFAAIHGADNEKPRRLDRLGFTNWMGWGIVLHRARQRFHGQGTSQGAPGLSIWVCKMP